MLGATPDVRCGILGPPVVTRRVAHGTRGPQRGEASPAEEGRISRNKAGSKTTVKKPPGQKTDTWISTLYPQESGLSSLQGQRPESRGGLRHTERGVQESCSALDRRHPEAEAEKGGDFLRVPQKVLEKCFQGRSSWGRVLFTPVCAGAGTERQGAGLEQVTTKSTDTSSVACGGGGGWGVAGAAGLTPRARGSGEGRNARSRTAACPSGPGAGVQGCRSAGVQGFSIRRRALGVCVCRLSRTKAPSFRETPACGSWSQSNNCFVSRTVWTRPPRQLEAVVHWNNSHESNFCKNK